MYIYMQVTYGQVDTKMILLAAGITRDVLSFTVATTHIWAIISIMFR